MQLRVHTGAVKVYGHVFQKNPTFSPLFAPYTSFCQTLFVESTSRTLHSDEISKAIEKKRGKGEKRDLAVIILKPLKSEVPEGWFEMPRAFAEKFKSSDPFLIPGFYPLMDVPMGMPPFYPRILFPCCKLKKGLFFTFPCYPSFSLC